MELSCLFVYTLSSVLSTLLIPRLVKMMWKKRPGFSLFHLDVAIFSLSLPIHIPEHTRFRLITQHGQHKGFVVGAYQTITYITLGIQTVQQPLSFHIEMLQLEGEIHLTEAVI